MKTKRWLSTVNAVLVLVLLAATVAACTGAPAPAAPAAPAATEAAPAEAPAEAAAPSGDAVELAFWSMWNENEPQAKVIQSWIDAFQQENPNVKISPVWNGRQNQTLVRTALNSGTKIDFVDQDSDPLAGGLMSEGQGYPLDEFLTVNALDEETPITDVFVPGVLNSSRGKMARLPSGPMSTTRSSSGTTRACLPRSVLSRPRPMKNGWR